MEYYCYNGRRIETPTALFQNFRGRTNRNRKRTLFYIALVSTICTFGIFYQMKQEERLLEQRWNNVAANYSTDCDIAVAMASDLQSTRGIYASINSIVTNYQDSRKLCFFMFSTLEDADVRKQGMDCVFELGQEESESQSESQSEGLPSGLPSNVQIIHKQIRRDTWEPVIYSQSELEQESKWALEYLYIRYMLNPPDVEGMQRVIWIDSDTIVRGNIAELYDWDLQGRPVAGAKYWEPLKNYLCTNPRLERIKMKTRFGSTSPFRVKDHLNTGLLVIDLYQMHRQKILDKWHDLVISHELDCLWTESDKAFDLALNGHYAELPNVWNVGYLGTQEYHRYNGACQKAKMLHWNGSGKPYTNGGRGVSLCVDQFDEYDVVSLQNKVECMISTS
jgi:lipopolysaccharide biosynthesis glycosyltransferase